MDGSKGCFVCRSEACCGLPASLGDRLESALNIELSPVVRENLLVCKPCYAKLREIEELVSQLQQLHNNRNDSRAARKRKAGFELPINEDSESDASKPKVWRNKKPQVSKHSPKRKIWTSSQPYTREDREAMHHCTDCRLMFVSYPSLIRHCIKEHGKRWVCPHRHCHLSFVKRDHLSLHKVTHNKMISLLPSGTIAYDHATIVSDADGPATDPDNSFPDEKMDEVVHQGVKQKVARLEKEEGAQEGDEGAQEGDEGEQEGADVGDFVPEYPCPVCDNEYRREIHLKKHVEISHWYKSLDMLYCTNCNEEYSRLEDMMPHAREHRRHMLKCSQCAQVFINKTHLLRHRSVTHSDKENTSLPRTQCTKCDKDFDTLSLLSYHNLLSHGVVTRLMVPRPVYEYQCGQCDMSFPFIKDLRYHVKSTHGPTTSVYTCDHCDENFADEAALVAHMDLCNTPEQCQDLVNLTDYHLPCAICDSVYDNVLQLEIHINKLHWAENQCEASFTCCTCSVVMSEKSAIIEHVRGHRSLMAACSRCPGSAIPNATQLNLHNVMVHGDHHEPDTSVYVCGSCSEKADSLHSLSFHMLTFHNQYLQVPILHKYLFKCRKCEKSFSSSSALRVHTQSNHTHAHPRVKRPREEHACPTCGDKFDEEFVLEHHISQCSGNPRPNNGKPNKLKKQQHRKTPNRKRLYHCEACGVTYKTSYTYNIHMEEHNGESTIECEHCKKCFYTYAQLKNHQLSHTKPHQCQLCHARFAQKAHLRDHSAVHDKDKGKYPCDICDKTFRWRYSLSRHRSSEHNIGYKYKEQNSRVSCTICGSTMKLAGIKRHFKNVHKDVQFDESHIVTVSDVNVQTKTREKKAKKSKDQVAALTPSNSSDHGAVSAVNNLLNKDNTSYVNQNGTECNDDKSVNTSSNDEGKTLVSMTNDTQSVIVGEDSSPIQLAATHVADGQPIYQLIQYRVLSGEGEGTGGSFSADSSSMEVLLETENSQNITEEVGAVEESQRVHTSGADSQVPQESGINSVGHVEALTNVQVGVLSSSDVTDEERTDNGQMTDRVLSAENDGSTSNAFSSEDIVITQEAAEMLADNITQNDTNTDNNQVMMINSLEIGEGGNVFVKRGDGGSGEMRGDGERDEGEVELVVMERDESNVVVEIPDGSTGSPVHYVITYQ